MANVYSKLNNMGKLKLGNITFPGYVVNASLSVDQQYNVTRPRGIIGTDGTVKIQTSGDGTVAPGIIYTGVEPRTLSYTIIMTSEEEVSEYINDIIPEMPYATLNTEVKPLQIVHSFANVHNITSVYIDDYSTAAPFADGWTIDLTLMENLQGGLIAQSIEQEKQPGEGGPKKTASTTSRSSLTGNTA